MVEHQLPKLRVASSSLVCRSIKKRSKSNLLERFLCTYIVSSFEVTTGTRRPRPTLYSLSKPGQLQNPVEMLKSHTNKNHHPKCPTSQIIFRSIIGEPEARGLLLTPARRTRSGRRPGHNAIQTEYKPGTGGLWFNRCLYHSSPVPGLSI